MDPVTLAVLVCIALVGGAVGGIAHRHITSRRRPLVVGEPVIVASVLNVSYHGVVRRQDAHGIVLDAAFLLSETQDPVAIGRVWVPKHRIDFVQTGVAPVDVLVANGKQPDPPLPGRGGLAGVSAGQG